MGTLKKTELSLPVSMMVWSVYDPVLEQPGLLDRQFAELAAAGFDGVAVFVRCSRYTWHDPIARKALARIGRLCRQAGLQYWVGPDPRFISRTLIGDAGGAELVLFGDSTRASRFPHTVPVHNGRYAVRCMLAPRHVHMLHEVAVEYLPLGILRAYAVRSDGGPLEDGAVRDITGSCSMFYNARDRYVEAFGTFRPPDDGRWNVVAFFHVRSSHVDYSDRSQMRHYGSCLTDLRDAGVLADALMWDEPGYTCTYGSLPFTPGIRRQCRRLFGQRFERHFWKLAFDAADGSHIPLRIGYYRTVQATVNTAQRSTNTLMRRLWGPGALASIHDTWHFESADMCDMNHGSMDLWRGADVKSGGFVDLGGVNELRDPSSGHYANLAAMSVIAASLGRHRQARCAFNNLWTVGDDDGEGWQTTVMDHCVNVLALFGTRWLAHAYGPVGTVGQERTFLGSPPLPGYPDHSTWPSFPVWNGRLRDHWRTTGGVLPSVNLLVAYPVETLYALADPRADQVAAAFFRLILDLVDAQYQVEVLSPEMIARGRWLGNRYQIGSQAYDAILSPFARVVDAGFLRRAAARPERFAWIGDTPQRTGTNRVVRGASSREVVATDHVQEWLASRGVPRIARGPEGTWITARALPGSTVVSVMPARHGGFVEGEVSYGRIRMSIARHQGLVRVDIPDRGTPTVHAAEEGTA